jgi:polyisoprenyl-teichoic acid--peptidoglycan teichoic acid transferase
VRPAAQAPNAGAQSVATGVPVQTKPSQTSRRSLSQMAVQSALSQQPAKVAPRPRQRMQIPITPGTPALEAQQYAPHQVAQSNLLDMNLPGADSPVRASGMFTAKWRRARTWAFRGVALSLILVITLGGLFLSQSFLKVNKAFKGTTGTAAALKEKVDPNLLKGEGDGRVNILLLGRGGGDHTAPDLTDTMIVASVDPFNKTATLLSVPRDLWVQVPGGGPMKINAAWATGGYKQQGKVRTITDPVAVQAGFKNVDTVVESALGIKIHYNMIVDFKAFKQAVDTVGGVSVNVPADLVDPSMAWENKNNPVLAKAGMQTFDGTAALRYVRSRHTSSDFARGERQRAVMLGIKSKVQELGTLSNPMKISGLLGAFGNNVSTDLSLGNANRLYGILKSINEPNITSTSLANTGSSLVTTANVRGQSVVMPKAGMFNFTEIQNYVRTQLKDPLIMRENAKVLILNGTPQPGIANVKSNELKSFGYNVVGIGNTPNTGWTQTTLVDLTGKHKYTRNYLEKRLGMSAVNSLSDTTIHTNGADFVIIIGSDATVTSQN